MSFRPVWQDCSILREDRQRGSGTRGIGRWNIGDSALWPIALLLTVALVLLINPIGYLGGGLDDWHYLTAARCWRDHAPCLPHDHWSGRWPLVLPFGLVLGLFGESRLTVGIIPLLASIACLFLLARIGNRLFGSPVGWIAALLLLAVPGFSSKMLMPSVDAMELGFVLAGFCALIEWRDSPKLWWPAVAGLTFSMAIQVRETAAFAAMTAALLILCSSRMRSLRALSVAAAAFAAPFLVEFTVFAAWTGDPLWRRHLSMHHTEIPSSELVGPIDRSRPPFFNRNYIANWRFEPGIHVHWLFDGILNLMVNVQAGLSLSLVPVLLMVSKAGVGAADRRATLLLWCCGTLNALALIFILAINPTPRMMLFPLASSSLALALITWRMLPNHSALVVAVWLACALVGATILATLPSTSSLTSAGAAWMREHPGEIETDETTRRVLALIPETSTLPPLGSGKRYTLIYTPGSCTEWIAASALTREAVIAADASAATAIARAARLQVGSLCLIDMRDVVVRNGGPR
jgi:hypothetical protein